MRAFILVAALLSEASSAFVPHAPMSIAPRSARAARCSIKMKTDHGEGKVNRRVVLALASLPLLGLRKAEAMTEAEEMAKLQAEAARIQEIFDVQKAASSNLPSLKDSLKAAKLAGPIDKDDSPAVVKADPKVDMDNVGKVVADLMATLQTEGDKGMEKVLATSAPGNPFVDLGYEKVCMYMRESKLAVLLGHFEQFKIISNKDMGMDDKGRVRYQVDVQVKAPYKTMLQNGMQFADIYMPKENDKDMLCAATVRWKMCKEPDGKIENMGCVVIDPIPA